MQYSQFSPLNALWSSISAVHVGAGAEAKASSISLRSTTLSSFSPSRRLNQHFFQQQQGKSPGPSPS